VAGLVIGLLLLLLIIVIVGVLLLRHYRAPVLPAEAKVGEALPGTAATAGNEFWIPEENAIVSFVE
jgi:hypothetical protein